MRYQVTLGKKVHDIETRDEIVIKHTDSFKWAGGLSIYHILRFCERRNIRVWIVDDSGRRILIPPYTH